MKYKGFSVSDEADNSIQLWYFPFDKGADAQNAPTPVTSYALFHDGEYVTNEQMNDKRFLKLIGQ